MPPQEEARGSLIEGRTYRVELVTPTENTSHVTCFGSWQPNTGSTAEPIQQDIQLPPNHSRSLEGLVPPLQDYRWLLLTVTVPEGNSASIRVVEIDGDVEQVVEQEELVGDILWTHAIDLDF